MVGLFEALQKLLLDVDRVNTVEDCSRCCPGEDMNEEAMPHRQALGEHWLVSLNTVNESLERLRHLQRLLNFGDKVKG